MMLRCSCAALLLSTVGLSIQAGDWRQFRGNAGNALSADAAVPIELSGETIRWKSALPGRGLSGPIVIGDRVVVTASSGHRELKLHTLCFDAGSGEQIWERTHLATGRTVCHPKMCVATPTPASDGERIFSFYSSSDLACLDLDGNLLWYRGLGLEFPNASNSLGMSSSPVVVGRTVIVQVESDAESFAAGLDTATGQTKWKLTRPRRANWTSPSVGGGANPVALLQSTSGLTAVDPETGEELWTYDNGASSIPSATVVDDLVFIPSHGITVLRMSPDRRSFEVAWAKTNLNPATPSPVAADGRLYTVAGTVLTCANASSGEKLWQMRLKGPFSSTPLAAGGHLYFFNEGGLASVIRVSDEGGEIVSELDLGGTILCTPAIADGGLFVRSDEELIKLARP